MNRNMAANLNPDVGYFARADYDFATGQPGDMCFRCNDIIFVVKSIDANWSSGRSLNGLSNGMFPSNFVSKLVLPDTASLAAGQKILVCTNPFTSQQAGDLSIDTGLLILGRRKIDENWWEGALLDPKGRLTAQKGIFPANHVQELIPPSQSDPSVFDTVPSGVKARVLKNLKAQLPEEIDLFQDEIVFITEFMDSMWCRGVSQDRNRNGMFPKGFVQLLEEERPAAKPVFKPVKTTSPPRYPPPPLPDSILDLSDELAPYGRSKYAFKSEFSNELGFPAGEIIKLLRHVDEEWTEGEFKGKMGIFPTSYVDIIVDCVSSSPPPMASLIDSGYVSSSSDNAFLHDGQTSTDYRTVLFDFLGTEKEDLSVRAGDRIIVCREVNADWLEACLSNNRDRKGLVPKKFVESTKVVVDLSGDSVVKLRGSPRRQGNWHKQMNRQSLDETISKNLTNLDLTTNRQSVQSTVFRQESSTSQQSAIMNKSSLLVPSSQRPSTDSDVFFTPPTTPLVGKERNNCQRSVSSTPPPRPLNSPAIRHKSPVDLERIEREKREKEEQRLKQERDQRIKVASELVKSERAFVRELEICQRCLGIAKGRLDSEILLRGFQEVNALSNRVLGRLDHEMNKDFSAQEFGAIFIDLEQEFRADYDHFCEAHDEAMILLERYEHDSSAQATLKTCLQKMKQEGSNCLDISSVLSRPLHRMMKYPLFLSELLKCTEDMHVDKRKLVEAVRIMTEVAQCINETKRRKDLVHKYRKDSDATFTERLSKLNLHSVRKKGSRFSVRMSRTIGLTSLVRDESFEQAEREYRDTVKAVRHMLKDLQCYCEQLQHCMVSQYSMAESWKDVWAKGGQIQVSESVKSDLRAYQDVWKRIGDVFLPVLFQKIKERVRHPLNELNFMFQGPEKLIVKRGDKLLDYEAVAGKHGVNEQERAARAEYEALNRQLVTELPKLTRQSQEVLRICVRTLLGAQRTFANELRGSFKSLDHHKRALGSVWPAFEARHQRALKDLSALTCISKSGITGPTEKNGAVPTNQRMSVRGSQRFKGNLKTSNRGKIAFPQHPQTEADRSSLRAKWGAAGQMGQVFVAAVPYAPVNAELDLNVNKGDLLLALIQKDPMGNPDRWYMDNGSSKGFVPRAVLVPLSEKEASAPRRPPLTKEFIAPMPPTATAPSVKRQISDGALIDLSENRKEPRPLPSHVGDLVGLNLRSEPAPKPQPLPNVPRRPAYENVGCDLPEKKQKRVPVRSAPAPPKNVSAVVDKERLSPDYAEKVEEEAVEFWVAEFDFDASDSNELSVAGGQILAVHMKEDLEGNKEWWLVEDEFGGVGYVPDNYLQIYNG